MVKASAFAVVSYADSTITNACHTQDRRLQESQAAACGGALCQDITRMAEHAWRRWQGRVHAATWFVRSMSVRLWPVALSVALTSRSTKLPGSTPRPLARDLGDARAQLAQALGRPCLPAAQHACHFTGLGLLHVPWGALACLVVPQSPLQDLTPSF